MPHLINPLDDCGVPLVGRKEHVDYIKWLHSLGLLECGQWRRCGDSWSACSCRPSGAGPMGWSSSLPRGARLMACKVARNAREDALWRRLCFGVLAIMELMISIEAHMLPDAQMATWLFESSTILLFLDVDGVVQEHPLTVLAS